MTGVQLEYLPPYSPDFNPIEEAFVELRQWIRLNYMMADNDNSYQAFLEAALQAQVGKPGNHFHSCQISIEDDL